MKHLADITRINGADIEPIGNRAKVRSKTFPGIAKAMAEQWGGICADQQ